jgi:hypothetical protein
LRRAFSCCGYVAMTSLIFIGFYYLRVTRRDTLATYARVPADE